MTHVKRVDRSRSTVAIVECGGHCVNGYVRRPKGIVVSLFRTRRLTCVIPSPTCHDDAS